eukprot:Seg2152.3 transcript_id=Seg2152.3/GoldUCD/mRNA.D3Y31 product="hypothetical protein" protein_id=Seg2152.3/GoldUCD/D3Y31
MVTCRLKPYGPGQKASWFADEKSCDLIKSFLVFRLHNDEHELPELDNELSVLSTTGGLQQLPSLPSPRKLLPRAGYPTATITV